MKLILVATVSSYKDLKVWQRAFDLSLSVYKITKAFPPDEVYGLTSQVRRASVSVPSNIAEGWGRGSTKEYIRFLKISRGSLFELDSQLSMAGRLEYLSSEQNRFMSIEINEIGRMLNGLIGKLEMKL